MATNAASAGSAADDHDDDDMRDAPFETDMEDALHGHAQPGRFTVGEDDMPDLIDLVDTSVPHASPPPEARYAEECRAYRLPPPTETRSAPPSEVNGHHRDPPIQPWPQSSSSSPAWSSAREMANVSLDAMVNRSLADSDPSPIIGPRHSTTFPPATTGQKVPEMQERGGTTSPFFLHQAKGKGVGGGSQPASGGMMDMELDEDKVVRLEEIEDGGHQ
ncbi:hypothetical protein GE09DRAFT_1053295 [Coniochaeta sp. 2T2.1]|nr:hypothetical protein GE09DRAFT_1053295 [Coniochaeta sp. 2T2.1]